MEHYQVGCPDVLTIEIAGSPPVKMRKSVDTDGRIDLGKYGKPRVEGRSPVQIAALITENLELPHDSVQVQVAEYLSQQVFLFGEAVGWQRSVSYRGQETVLDLLQRAGAATHGPEVGEVYVVRAHISDGGRPEVYHVNLDAIVNKHDQNTNLRLLPNDQIYVGETTQARFEKSLPAWLRK